MSMPRQKSKAQMDMPSDPQEESVYTLIQHSLTPKNTSKPLHRSSFAEAVRVNFHAARKISKPMSVPRTAMTSSMSPLIVPASRANSLSCLPSNKLPPISPRHRFDCSANVARDQTSVATTRYNESLNHVSKISNPSLQQTPRHLPPLPNHERFTTSSSQRTNRTILPAERHNRPSTRSKHVKKDSLPPSGASLKSSKSVAPAAEEYHTRNRSAHRNAHPIAKNTPTATRSIHAKMTSVHDVNSTRDVFESAANKNVDAIQAVPGTHTTAAMSDVERNSVIKILRKDLAKAMVLYGKLPITHETPSRLQRKRALEQRIYDLEHNIQTISNGESICVG
ncbi:hypothetical protein BASA83_004094 [Batrachochytrium salamandrivorans]|nr:hypothetical protein BASA83_004094 [Batrachochytrium salamandrivorans]